MKIWLNAGWLFQMIEVVVQGSRIRDSNPLLRRRLNVFEPIKNYEQFIKSRWAVSDDRSRYLYKVVVSGTRILYYIGGSEKVNTSVPFSVLSLDTGWGAVFTPQRRFDSFINEQNMLPRLYTFCRDSLPEGRIAALRRTWRGERFPCSYSSLLLSFSLTASLATPTQRRHFSSRRLARAYVCGLVSYCCCYSNTPRDLFVFCCSEYYVFLVHLTSSVLSHFSKSQLFILIYFYGYPAFALFETRNIHCA